MNLFIVLLVLSRAENIVHLELVLLKDLIESKEDLSNLYATKTGWMSNSEKSKAFSFSRSTGLKRCFFSWWILTTHWTPQEVIFVHFFWYSDTQNHRCCSQETCSSDDQVTNSKRWNFFVFFNNSHTNCAYLVDNLGICGRDLIWETTDSTSECHGWRRLPEFSWVSEFKASRVPCLVMFEPTSVMTESLICSISWAPNSFI